MIFLLRLSLVIAIYVAIFALSQHPYATPLAFAGGLAIGIHEALIATGRIYGNSEAPSRAIRMIGVAIILIGVILAVSSGPAWGSLVTYIGTYLLGYFGTFIWDTYDRGIEA